MTRTLPWKTRSSTSVQAKKPATPPSHRVKRPRLIEQDSEDEDTEIGEPSRHSTPNLRGPRLSTSPIRPLEQPSESFMDEGMENDDGFRMVEDEFLDAAKQFTKYLHAAEYRRMKKTAKSQNAETIGSISRPVTTRMPDETRRKVESTSRLKTQASVVGGLLGKHANESESDNEFDEARGPWIGTALHGLMDSPRKKAPSLMKLGGINVGTRAAAGFQKSHASNSLQSTPSNSQTLANRPAPPPNKYMTSEKGEETSSEEDDDLDAPIRKRKLFTPSRTQSSPTAVLTPSRISGILITSQVTRTERNMKPESTVDLLPSQATETHSLTHINQATLESKARVARRLEQAKAHKLKAEKDGRKKRLHDIPTFL